MGARAVGFAVARVVGFAVGARVVGFNVGARVGIFNVGARVGIFDEGTLVDIETKSIEIPALAGVVLVTMEFTVMRKVLDVPLKFGIV